MTHKPFLLIFFLTFVFASAVQAQDTLTVNARGNPQRSGVYEAETIDTSPIVAWQDSFAATDVEAFVAADQLFVVATEQRNKGTLYAMTTSGERLWSVPLPGALMGAMAYSNGLLFAGTSTGRLIAIDAQNGETRWTFSQGGRVWGTPLVVDDHIYIASARGVFALAIESGEEIWHNDACRDASSPVLSEIMLLYPCQTTIEAVDAGTGEGLWSLALEAGPVYSLAVEGTVLAATGEQSLYAVDLTKRAVMWVTTPGQNWSAPIVTQDKVFGGSMNGTMDAYDRASGDLIWSLKTEDWATTDPVLIGDTLYFGIGNHFDPASPRPFYALDANSGEILWQFRMDGMIISEAAVGDRRLYVTTNNGTLYALSDLAAE